MGKSIKKKNPGLSVHTSMYPHTFFSNSNTKPIIEAVGTSLRHFGSQDKTEATNLPNTEFLCFEFLRLVEVLANSVYSVNFRHYLGIYATFLVNLRRFGENFTPIYTTWGRGLESL